MKVLMMGWEFPPFFAGGLGVVCYEMTKELVKNSEIEDLKYLMPYGPENYNSHIELLGANQVKNSKDNAKSKNNIEIIKIPSTISSPYMTPEEFEIMLKKDKIKTEDIDFTNQKNAKTILYGNNMFEEVTLFAERTARLISNIDFDIIHAHDWMTMPAAIIAKQISGKPLIVQIHNTIYDRYLGRGGFHEKELELRGMHYADKIIAISNFVKNTLVQKYGINPEKIVVIHNGATTMNEKRFIPPKEWENKKIVLIAGRMTLQKGGEYLVEAAAKALKYYPNIMFVVAGSGDQISRMKYLVKKYNIEQNFYFHGFYTMEEREQFFGMADLFVMPSVSEPFGIVPLEAMAKGTPCIISKQSGVSEVIGHCFKTDFWDIDRMANQIISVLKYNILHKHLSDQGYKEVKQITWDIPAKKMIELYKEVLNA